MVRAALTATAATACLAFAAPAWASAPLAQLAPSNGHNPKGDNGTVKIDGQPFTDKVDNQPHVTCEFELEFFNFDTNQKADITLTSQPPSTPRKVVWSVQNKIVSTDPAAGAENDHDEVIRLSAADLDLAGVTAHDKQGYHLKLDVDLVDGRSSDAKHKVFWLKPCSDSGEPATEAPQPGGAGSPFADPSAGTPGGTPAPSSSVGAGDGSGGSGGGLPVTGVAATSMALTGVALIGGGAALVLLRRRRDRITFTS
ncbi:LPXTG cell wall anchor domain-containing protein [Micromonospora sp. B11E3]|uniref:LPXTG cell wall anchor domain-containing protein n=1 Tax=Micromonospora sp. B11E3 TaxID=3153562 RepID=UPI00325CEFD3